MVDGRSTEEEDIEGGGMMGPHDHDEDEEDDHGIVPSDSDDNGHGMRETRSTMQMRMTTTRWGRTWLWTGRRRRSWWRCRTG